MTEKKETVFDALGVENPSKELKDEFQAIAFKCTTMPGYTRSDAVLDIIKTVGVEDTPDTRRLCAHAMSFGEGMQNLQQKLGMLARSMGLDADED